VAPTSRNPYTRSASPCTACRVSSNSYLIFNTPDGETTRCVSMSGTSRNTSSMRTAYTDPVAPVMPMTKRRLLATKCACVLQCCDQLARLVHLSHNVRTTNELAAHVELRNGWPTGILFDAQTHLFVFQHINRCQLGHTRGFQNLNS